MKLEKLVLLSALPTARWSSGEVGLMLQGREEFFFLCSLCSCPLWARAGARRCSGLLEEYQKAAGSTSVMLCWLILERLLVDLFKI